MHILLQGGPLYAHGPLVLFPPRSIPILNANGSPELVDVMCRVLADLEPLLGSWWSSPGGMLPVACCAVRLPQGQPDST